MKFVIPGRLDGLNEYTSANRTNPYAGGAMKKRNEKIVMNALMAQGIREHFEEPVYLRFCWVEKNKRRDPDNIIAGGVKYCLDALVKMGVLRGDGWRDILGFSHRFAVDKENPRIEVEILTKAEADERRKKFIESIRAGEDMQEW